MRVIALRTIKRFTGSKPEYADAPEPALAWYRQALHADWASPAAVKRDIRSASILKDGKWYSCKVLQRWTRKTHYKPN